MYGINKPFVGDCRRDIYLVMWFVTSSKFIQFDSVQVFYNVRCLMNLTAGIYRGRWVTYSNVSRHMHWSNSDNEITVRCVQKYEKKTISSYSLEKSQNFYFLFYDTFLDDRVYMNFSCILIFRYKNIIS